MVRAVHYGFSQGPNVSVRTAFAWCTDYSPDDMRLMQEEKATRKVQHISDDVIILTDTFVSKGKRVVKRKLVCLYPDRFTWTATHLTGPNKHSQFLYEITAQNGKQCCLKFTGLQVDYAIKEDAEVARLSQELKKMDSNNWKLLASEMEKELKTKCNNKN